LFVICHLVDFFPKRIPFLGWEVPFLALIRPIPRAIWPGKPQGLTTTIEEALDAQGLTLASSFVGEAHIAGGVIAIVLTGFFFGYLAVWWSHLGTTKNSDFGVLIYASGFFAAVISMRSLFVFTTAILPTIVAIIGGSMIIQKVSRSRPRFQSPGPGPWRVRHGHGSTGRYET
jgi:hypothetical protein